MDWEAVRKSVEIEFSCNCTCRVLTYFEASNGTRHYRLQCTRCGKYKSVRKADYSFRQIEAALPFDEALRDNYGNRKYARRLELSEQMENEDRRQWWARYERYLESHQWMDKRQRVLERDGFRCKACERRPATEVHHLSYKHVFQEPLFDLISVCKICHEAITRHDREC